MSSSQNKLAMREICARRAQERLPQRKVIEPDTVEWAKNAAYFEDHILKIRSKNSYEECDKILRFLRQIMVNTLNGCNSGNGPDEIEIRDNELLKKYVTDNESGMKIIRQVGFIYTVYEHEELLHLRKWYLKRDVTEQLLKTARDILEKHLLTVKTQMKKAKNVEDRTKLVEQGRREQALQAFKEDRINVKRREDLVRRGVIAEEDVPPVNRNMRKGKLVVHTLSSLSKEEPASAPKSNTRDSYATF